MNRRSPWLLVLPLIAAGALVGWNVVGADPVAKSPPDHKTEFATAVQPILKKYCLTCHSTKAKKGSLDLERFASLEAVRKDLKPWQQTIEMIEAGEMPPKGKPQPTAAERRQLLAWITGFLDAEAHARAGDPGFVPLRRLSNAEYDWTIRDLTGVDLRPTREFPADGAGGEGFTNAAEALSDISPALLTKYLNAAKEIAQHAVLLPDGFRFSPTKTRRDWTNESVAQIRSFYADFTADGKLPLQGHLAATVRHREALASGKLTPADVARAEKLNPKYLAILWQTLTDKMPSYPLDRIRARWAKATDKDVGALSAEIAAWQAVLWKFEAIGSYRYGNTLWQHPSNPAAATSQPVRLAVKPAPGQGEVVLSLVARETPTAKAGRIVWHRPRFEKAGQAPLLLRDYATFGPAYEVDFTTIFATSARYLAAAARVAHDGKQSIEALARKENLNAALLKRWTMVLALEPVADARDPQQLGRRVPTFALDRLDEVKPKGNLPRAINGWQCKGRELPMLLTNSSDNTEHVPGTMRPHTVAVHPTPTEFVGAVWKSPVAGKVRVALRVAHAHPACGNGVAWWLEHRRAGHAAVLAEGTIDLGGKASPPGKLLDLKKGDRLILAVDARDGNHGCDLTDIGLTLTEINKPARTWDLAADVADSILEGNPHADKHGNKHTWSFVKGPSRPVGKGILHIPADSLLGRWREAAADPGRQREAGKLADAVQALLAGPRPVKDKHPDRTLFDYLVSVESPLFTGLDLARLGKAKPRSARLGLERSRFGKNPGGKPIDPASLPADANSVTEVRLPATLFRDREFVAEGRLDEEPVDRAVRFSAFIGPDPTNDRWDGKSPVVASPTGAGYKRMLQGYADFRRCFPSFICFPHVIPTDEVVCLKMYHREDEPLVRLFLDGNQKRRLDRLWREQQFISRQPVAEYKYLPQFIGFVTQDQPKELLAYFESQREPFRKRAEAFEMNVESAVGKQMDQLLAFAARAYRRPLLDREKADLLALHQALRKKGVSREEAFQGVLARVLVSPAFLFRIEQAPAGKEARPIDDWELASRLSYFLWSSTPDDTLRKLAGAGQLHTPKILAEQVRRMLGDDRVRALAIEFGTQWIHVRGIDELKEKNEKLYPTFDANLRKAIYEESILFFQDLFRADRPVSDLLDADATFLNETLAKHYGIPGIGGPQWRRVAGVRKYGRGGILGLASVQAKQSGSSRTSPILRGNWVVETLLGEKLPRPPADVPQLPDVEGGSDGLTTRQRVEKHVQDARCAVCHQRIDPFGFALERYDTIGRRRDRDGGGKPIDARAKLRDGTQFDDIDGLRTYLMKKKKEVIVRLFCKKLLGYALGRAVTLSDQSLLDEIVNNLNNNDGRLSNAVLTIVRSKQFRMIRGREFANPE